MKRKLPLVLLAIIVVMASSAGCRGDSGTADQTKEKIQSQEVETEDETKSGGAAGEVREITVWAWDSAFNGYAMEEADKLYDDAKINFVEMSKADCLQKLHTALASGVTDSLPDIVLIGDLSAQGYLMSYPGAFKSMDDIINYEDFASYKREAVSYDKVGYGVPFDTGVAGLFYRTDYIEEAGYTLEDMQDLTWEEYLEIGVKLKENGHLLQTFNPNDIGEFQIMLQSAGTWYTDDEGLVNFAKNAALNECFDIFKELNESDYCKVVSDWGEFAGAINSGEVACVIRGSWISPTIMAEESQSGKWALAPIPKLSVEGATNRSNQGGSSWYVLNNGKNAELAADFLAETFAGNNELYNILLNNKNIIGTYLPASNVEALDFGHEFYGEQKVNKELQEWLEEVPPVNTGAFTSEAQAALLAVTPNILAGQDLTENLKEAVVQFEQSIQ